MKVDQQLIRTVDVHDRAGIVVGSKDVVPYAGLLSQAHEEGLARVRTSILQIPTEENGRLAIIKAEVETSKGMSEVLGFGCPEKAIYLLRELREGLLPGPKLEPSIITRLSRLWQRVHAAGCRHDALDESPDDLPCPWRVVR